MDAENHYARAQGFWLYMLMYGGGIQYLMFNMLKMTQTYQNRGRVLIYGLAVFLVAGTMIQIVLPTLHITWLCVTLISSALITSTANEMWNQLDGLTGLLSPEELSEPDTEPPAGG